MKYREGPNEGLNDGCWIDGPGLTGGNGPPAPGVGRVGTAGMPGIDSPIVGAGLVLVVSVGTILVQGSNGRFGSDPTLVLVLVGVIVGVGVGRCIGTGMC